MYVTLSVFQRWYMCLQFYFVLAQYTHVCWSKIICQPCLANVKSPLREYLIYPIYEDKHTTESSKHNQLKEEKHIKIGWKKLYILSRCKFSEFAHLSFNGPPIEHFEKKNPLIFDEYFLIECHTPLRTLLCIFSERDFPKESIEKFPSRTINYLYPYKTPHLAPLSLFLLMQISYLKKNYVEVYHMNIQLMCGSNWFQGRLKYKRLRTCNGNNSNDTLG